MQSCRGDTHYLTGRTLRGLLSVHISGQIRVRVMETLYRLELRHHGCPADSSDSRRKLNVSTDWLCAWSGSEHMCVNASRRLGDWETGEVQARLFHSSGLLNGTGNGRSWCFTHCGSRRNSH